MATATGGPQGADREKWAAVWFRKGVEAMNKQNWPLAVESFAMCVTMKPDNLGFRQNLRGCTQKKYADNGSGAGALAKTKLMGIRSRIKKARAAGAWNEVDKACEEGLQLNPWDVQLNAELANACKEQGWTEIAAWSYALARKSDMNNIELNKALAAVLEGRGQYKEAVAVWEHLYKLDPKNGEARSKIMGLQTKETTERGGYDDATSTRDVRIGKPAPGRGKETVAPGQSIEVDLKHAIRKEPEKVENYMKLADHYRRNRNLDAAQELLQKALEVSGSDAGVREILEDVELEQLVANLELAKAAAATSGSDTDRQNSAALAQELLKREVEVLSARVERYPADLNRKYELATRFMRMQKWALAIPLLQKASQDPRMKGKALVALGKSFLYDKKVSLARGQFERSLPELNSEQDPDSFKEAHYLLARVCEELGDKTSAEKYYGEVLVHDYEYKDAKDRLEKLQGGG
ncbi:MAG: tetratricopeptide repeat protein [Planctomyces sp.]|nr:tetratricopeptide repeat protein [Planctomyces sp.]